MLAYARRYVIDGGIEPLYVLLVDFFRWHTKGNNCCSVNLNHTDVTQGISDSHHGQYEKGVDDLCRTFPQTLILYI